MAASGLAGCAGPLSTVDPAGPSAAAIASLWWAMLIGATLLFALVMALLLWVFLKPATDRSASPKLWLVGGGLVLPALVLTPLLGYGLYVGERLLAHPRADAPVRIDVEVRQWQWTFRYPGPDGTRVSVNELHLPVGRAADLHVTTADVIHGFWIPRLGGKVDAIPGHTNVVRLSASQPGHYRGVCAEFCGTGHTVMDFAVEAHDGDAFEAALDQLPKDAR
ncbi:cytochrome c oxidase subunit II [Rhodopseudomonas sp. AAP120]|uniref:cytochrome c oxidase subunit II n=1 Tax=Rhodopseudomonas sp. AAP120 TaxID=1523430 RepID=UPI000AC6E94A